MTKKDLILALQRFPEETQLEVRLSTSQETFGLKRVEMVMSSEPIAVEPSNAGDTWQAMLVPHLRLMLVAEGKIAREQGRYFGEMPKVEA